MLTPSEDGLARATALLSHVRDSIEIERHMDGE